MKLNAIPYKDGYIFVDETAEIKQADEGYFVYINTDNVYFTKGVHFLRPFNKEKDHFNLFHPDKNSDKSSYVVLKQDKQTNDFGTGYKFCNVKYLTKVVAQTDNILLTDVPIVELTDNWNLALRKMRDNKEFDDKFDTKTLEFIYAFQMGYKANQQLYTIEDIMKAIVYGHDKSTANEYLSRTLSNSNEFIKSLEPKLTSIEVSTETYQKDGKTHLKLINQN